MTASHPHLYSDPHALTLTRQRAAPLVVLVVHAALRLQRAVHDLLCQRWAPQKP